jgi:hypothetical protein
MAVSLDISINDEMAQRLSPMFTKRAREMARHPKVLAFLDGREIDDLTPQQRAKMVLRFWMYKDLLLYEREQAEIVAGQAAAAAVNQDFSLENDE